MRFVSTHTHKNNKQTNEQTIGENKSNVITFMTFVSFYRSFCMFIVVGVYSIWCGWLIKCLPCPASLCSKHFWFDLWLWVFYDHHQFFVIRMKFVILSSLGPHSHKYYYYIHIKNIFHIRAFFIWNFKKWLAQPRNLIKIIMNAFQSERVNTMGERTKRQRIAECWM